MQVFLGIDVILFQMKHDVETGCKSKDMVKMNIVVIPKSSSCWQINHMFVDNVENLLKFLHIVDNICIFYPIQFLEI